MLGTITFEDARQEGIIKPGDYFVTTAPKDRNVIVTRVETGFDENQKFKNKAGAQKLWRLENGLTMLGEPTKETLTLKGREGFEQGPNAMERVARELYSITDIFEQVRSCSLQERTYLFSELKKVLQTGRYAYLAHKKSYWLASHCVELYDSDADYIMLEMRLQMLYMCDDTVYVRALYDSDGKTSSDTRAVRPEATPKATLLLETEGCDGTRDRPWKCLNR